MQPRRLATLTLGAVLAILTTALGAGSVSAQDLPVYHATLLDTMVEEVFPGITWPGSDARGLNENGDLVGESLLNFDPEIGSQMQSFVYTVEHGVVALPLLPGWPSNAVRDVSDRDQNGEIIIVGGGVPGPYVDLVLGEAALWRYSTVTGEVLETRGLGIPAGFDDSFAVAVSNDGIIAGFSSVTGPFTNWKYDVAGDVLETFDFPARITDMNNAGQVCGGVYRGDLFGNWEDLTDVYQPGDVMPDWAIENGGISAGWHRINDLGWLVGRAATGISDGAGHYKVAIVRFADPIGWTGFPPVSHLSLAGGINNLGDFTNRDGGAYLEDLGQIYSLTLLLSEDFPNVGVYKSMEINSNRQVAGHQAHSFLLTPLGEMIVPGDVNGDVSVDLDDHCAWVANPIDLDGDGDADADDEQWLFDRLLVFGHVVEDCNGNGAGDHCDITGGLSADCDGNDQPDECQPDCSGDGVPDVCEPDCNANGVADACDIAEFTSLDCNENGIPDECDGGGVTQTMTVYDPPLQFIQNDLIVEETLVVDTGIVDDIDLYLDIRYRLGDLTVQLSHNGTTLTILDRPGSPQYAGGFVNFGYDATIDDEGTGPYLEYAGDSCCNFEWLESPPSYRPDTPQSAGFAVFDGMPSEGIWSLTITTTDHYSPGDGLLGWGLTITRAGADPGICDCNDNGTPDDGDIAHGTSADENANGVPDECESVPGDVNGDGFVDVGDLVAVILAWGACDPVELCPADMDGSGVVDVNDLVLVILSWG